MKKVIVTLLCFATLFAWSESVACTSAIVTAAKSSEGVPMLWKHRDSRKWGNVVAYVEGEKYAYTALVSTNGLATYCGINEKGFGVMNNATYNVPIPDESIKSKGAIGLMGEILGKCASVAEFEEWLKMSNGKRGYSTIYAVGDPSGEVAYFEVSQTSYTRFNAAEREEQYDTRGNFSFSGEEKDKRGVLRYESAKRQMKGKSVYTPQELIELSRNYINKDGFCILNDPKTEETDSNVIARYTSAASAVMVCDAKNPRMLVMSGHPSASMAVPVYVKAKNALPTCVSSRAMLELGNDFRANTYTKPENKKYQLNKTVVNKVVAVNTICDMPAELPKNINKFNAKIDKLFAKHEKSVRKAMK